MFTLRCLAVCLSFFGLVYAVASLLVPRFWRYSERSRWNSPQATAKFLMSLRVLPLWSAAFVAIGLVLPSFLWLEPRATAEPVGEIPAILGGLSLLLFAAGLRNGLTAWQRTSRAVRGWLTGAREEPACPGVSLFRIRASVPGLVVAGICEPRVLISDTVANALTAPELTAALKHELAHVRRHDNLKKFYLQCTAFPGMARLDAAWSEAAEMAADDAAVSNITEALDLASALIKLSRCVPANAAPVLATALAGSTLNARVERLVQWDQRPKTRPPASQRWYLAPALIGSMFCLAMSYGTLLSRMHQMTEWLVR
jgi:Zn-dependent protease with chaperone function